MNGDILQFAILFFAGALSGAVNALAGGGSFLTVSILIFSGLEPTVANATNRFGILIQSVFATQKFSRMGYFPKRYSYTAALPMVLGAGIGAYLVTVVSDASFKKYFAVFMVIMTLLTFLKPSTKELKEDVVFTGRAYFINFIVYFLIGIYGGFIQAGVGFMILTACVVSGLDMVRSHAVKLFMNLVAAAVSVVIFIYADKVLFLPAVVLGLGLSAGAVFAAGQSVKVSNDLLKKIVSGVMIIFAVLLLVFK